MRKAQEQASTVIRRRRPLPVHQHRRDCLRLRQLAIDDQQAGQIYNITSENLTQAELLGLACEIFGLDVRYEVMSDDACIAKFRQLMPERGEAVAQMLTGCFQSIRAGAFDVPSHFREAAGRPPRTVREMLEGLSR